MNNLSPHTTHVDPKIIARWQTKPLIERLCGWSGTLPKPLHLTEAMAQELMCEAARELEWRRRQQAPRHPFLMGMAKGFGFGLGCMALLLVACVVVIRL